MNFQTNLRLEEKQHSTKFKKFAIMKNVLLGYCEIKLDIRK